MALFVDLLTWLKSKTYLKGEIDTLLSGKSDTGHSHDDKYYTESEMDASLATKADADHNHDSDYAPLSHNHTKSQITDFAHTHAGSEVLIGQDTVATKISAMENAITALQNADWDIAFAASFESLPQEGAAGRLYYVSNGETGDNQYDEYIWDATNERYEKMGPRTIDLSGYVQIENCGLSLNDSGILTLSVQ